MAEPVMYSQCMSYHQGFEEGYRLGYCQGRASALIWVLEARGVAVRTADRDFILGCTNPGTLDTWSGRALKVSAIRELFDGAGT